MVVNFDCTIFLTEEERRMLFFRRFGFACPEPIDVILDLFSIPVTMKRSQWRELFVVTQSGMVKSDHLLVTPGGTVLTNSRSSRKRGTKGKNGQSEVSLGSVVKGPESSGDKLLDRPELDLSSSGGSGNSSESDVEYFDIFNTTDVSVSSNTNPGDGASAPPTVTTTTTLTSSGGEVSSVEQRPVLIPEEVYENNVLNRASSGMYHIGTSIIDYLKRIPEGTRAAICNGLSSLGNHVKRLFDEAIGRIVESTTQHVYNKLKPHIPAMMDGFVDVMSVCVLAYFGGFNVGAVSLSLLLGKWYGAKLLGDILDLGINPSLQDGESSNTGLIAIFGIGAVLARFMGVSIDYRYMASMSASILAISKCGDVLSDIVSFVVQLLPECISKWIPALLVKKRGSEEHYELIQKLSIMNDSKRSEETDEFYRSYSKLQAISAGISGPLRTQCTNILVKAAPHFLKISADRGINARRIPPAWIHFYGESGIGKSTLVETLIDELVSSGKFDCLKVHKNDLKYSRSVSDSFWSGYRGQPIVSYDDLYATTGEATALHAAELISQVSCETYMPPFASLADASVGIKGTLYSSKFIISTANTAVSTNLKLSHPIALKRRMLRCIKVLLYDNTVVKDGRLDTNLLYAKYGGEVNVNTYLPHLRFQFIDPLSDGTSALISKLFTFAETLRVVVDSCDDHFVACSKVSNRERFYGEGGIFHSRNIHLQVGETVETESKPGICNEIELRQEEKLDEFINPEEEEVSTISPTWNTFDECKCIDGHVCEDCLKYRYCVAVCAGIYKEIQQFDRIEETDSGVHSCASGEVDHVPSDWRSGESNGVVYNKLRKILGDSIDFSSLLAPTSCRYCCVRRFILSKHSHWIKSAFDDDVMRLVRGELTAPEYPLSSLGTQFNFYFPHRYLFVRKNTVEESFWLDLGKSILAVSAVIGGLYASFKALSLLHQNFTQINSSIKGGISCVGAALTGVLTSVKEVSDELSQASNVVDQSYNPEVTKRVNPVKKALNILASQVPGEQSGSVSQAMVAANNCVAFALLSYDSTVLIGNEMNRIRKSVGSGCVLLNSHHVLLLSHYFRDFRKSGSNNFSITITRSGSNPTDKRTFECCTNDLIRICEREYDSDFIVLKLSKGGLPSVRDHTSHWIKDTDKDINKSGAYLIGFSQFTESSSEPSLWMSNVTSTSVYEPPCGIPYLSSEVYDTKCWRYIAPVGATVAGNCGSILVFPHAGSRWFGGIHRALIPSCEETGWRTHEAQYVSQEMLSQAINRKIITQSALREVIPFKENPMLNVANKDLTIVGFLADPLRLSENSAFVKSPLHNDSLGGISAPFHPSEKEPSILSTNDPRHPAGRRSPMSLALDKYVSPKKRYDTRILTIATDWLKEDILLAKGDEDVWCRKLTLGEAINGISGVEYIDGIDMSTSPGLPYVKHRSPGVSGKEFLFSGEPGNWKVSSSLLETRIAERLRINKEGVVMIDSLWSDSLKDEKLKLSKIKESSTRVFNVAPLDHLLVAKMYLGAFLKYMQSRQNRCFSGIGINCSSTEWSQLFYYLRDQDPDYVGHDGDWKWFDGTIGTEVYFPTIEVVNEWYKRHDKDWSPEDDAVRYALLMEAFCPYECALDVVFTKEFGMPSGWLGTAVFNCLVNYLLGACFFLEKVCVDKRSWDTVKKKYYGDDNIYTYPRALSGVFNGAAMSKYFAEHGQTYTPASKDGEWKLVRPRDVDYLKRKTKVIQVHGKDVYLPLVSKQSINEAINWTRKGDLWANLDEQVKNVMDMLFFYGSKEYDLYRDYILKAAQDHHAYIGIPTFTEVAYRLCKPVGDMEVGAFPSSYLDSFLIMEQSGEITSVSTESSSGTTITIAGDVQSTQRADIGARAQPAMKVAELPITYDNIVSKWSVLPRLLWDQSTVQGDILLTRNVPMELINNSQVQRAFDNNSLVRCDAEVSVRISSTRFHQGILLVGFVPGITKEMFNVKYNGNIVALMNLPNKSMLYANVASECTVRCPYFSKYNYIRPEEYGDDTIRGTIGIFFVAVASPLAAATGAASTVPVLMSSRFDAEFHFPKPVEQSWLSGFMEAAARTTALITTSAQGISQAINIGKDALDVVSKMDRGPVPYMNIIARFGYGQYGSVDLPVPCDNLTLDSRGLTPTQTSHFCTTVDEMDLKYLLGVPNYLTTIQWDTSAASGTQLYSSMITPTLHHIKHGAMTEYQPTSIDYLMCMFGRWRGDIVIGLHFSATSFASGTLRVSAVQSFYGDTITMAETTGQTFASIDLSEGKREYTMRIPYNAPSNTRSILWRQLATIVGEARQEYGTGMWYLHVENPLTVGGDAPTTVDVIVTYKLENISIYDIPPVTWTNNLQIPVLQSGDIVLSAGDGSAVAACDNTMSVSSLRDMVRRFTFFSYLDTTTAAADLNVPYFRVMEVGEIGCIANCYAGARGGLYFKVSTSATSGVTRAYFWDPSPAEYNDYVDTRFSSGGSVHSIPSVGIAQSDVIVPFTCNYSFVSTKSSIGNNSGASAPIIDLNTGAFVLRTLTPAVTTLVPAAFFVAGGDDFRCGGWLGPPRSTIVYRN